MMITIFILGGVVILISVGLLAIMFMKSNRVNLANGADGKPEPVLFREDKGEHLASPFAEQIEDILNAMLEADPALKDFKIDLGTDKNDALEIWIDGTKYLNADEIPNEALRKAFHEAVKSWESKK